MQPGLLILKSLNEKNEIFYVTFGVILIFILQCLKDYLAYKISDNIDYDKYLFYFCRVETGILDNNCITIVYFD